MGLGWMQNVEQLTICGDAICNKHTPNPSQEGKCYDNRHIFSIDNNQFKIKWLLRDPESSSG